MGSPFGSSSRVAFGTKENGGIMLDRLREINRIYRTSSCIDITRASSIARVIQKSTKPRVFAI